MLSLERELSQLDPPPARLIAEERREIFSVFAELRAASYIAVALITTGVGIVVKENADRIGPLAIIAALLIAAAACYAFAIVKRERTIVGDYVLLLGALLVSAAVGYAESQFHYFGENWSRHLLLLAAIHIATAYVLDSRLVLSAGLTSLAAWFGVNKSLDVSATVGLKAMLCAVTVAVLRLANRHRPFDEVYEHFAATLAFIGAIALSWDESYRWLGVLVVVALAALVIWRGIRVKSEAFVVYSILALTLAVDGAIIGALAISSTEGLIPLFLLITTPIVIVILFAAHLKMKEVKR